MPDWDSGRELKKEMGCGKWLLEAKLAKRECGDKIVSVSGAAL